MCVTSQQLELKDTFEGWVVSQQASMLRESVLSICVLGEEGSWKIKQANKQNPKQKIQSLTLSLPSKKKKKKSSRINNLTNYIWVWKQPTKSSMEAVMSM